MSNLPNGMEVEEGPYGTRAVITGSWSEDIAKYILYKQICDLELNYAKGWIRSDLSFLSELGDALEAFSITDWNIESIEPIHCLIKLKVLTVYTYCSSEIRFAQFRNLRECTLHWRPKAKSVFECLTLRRLFIDGYNGKTTEQFGNLVNLEYLGLLNAPFTSTSGFRTLTKLRHLRLGALRCLESLDGLQYLKQLNRLDINTCRKLRRIDEIAGLTNLRELFINNCGDIETLKPIEKLDLVWVGFTETTNIVDGDLSPLLRQKHLTWVFFGDRKHYSLKRDDFPKSPPTPSR